MSYSYPLTMPTSPAPKSSTWKLKRAVGYGVSPFTGKQQVQEHDLALWQATITLPPMKREQAAQWQAFFMKLHGRYGTFLLGDPDAKSARGAVYDAATTYASTSVGNNVIYIDTALNNTAGVFKQGDYIQVGTGASALLFMVVEDSPTTDSSGRCAVTVEPRVKRTLNTGETVTHESAKGLFRMDTDELGWDADHVSRYGLTFSCTEAV